MAKTVAEMAREAASLALNNGIEITPKEIFDKAVSSGVLEDRMPDVTDKLDELDRLSKEAEELKMILDSKIKLTFLQEYNASGSHRLIVIGDKTNAMSPWCASEQIAKVEFEGNVYCGTSENYLGIFPRVFTVTPVDFERRRV